MTALNLLAVQNAAMLRALADDPAVSKLNLAAAIGKDRSNLNRSIAALAEAGLIEGVEDGGDRALTDDGRAQLAALDRAENPADAASSADGVLMARHDQLEPHPLNPRKDFETADAEEAIDELRQSLLLRGQLQNLVVRPQPDAGRYWIVAGESRWRAIGQAILDDDWSEDRPIRCDLREIGDGEHLITALTENLQRRALSPIEEGEAFAAAVHEFGLTTADLSDQIGKSQRYVQQRIALLKLSDADRDRMRLPSDHPDHLNFKEARNLTQTPREPGSSPPSPPTDRLPPTEELAASLAAQPAPKPFGERITDKEALILVELADKLERHPATDLDLYTRIQAMPTGGAASSLVEKGVIGFRQRGMAAYATLRHLSSGAGQWLDELGFDQHRADVLFEMRARVVGADKATALDTGAYLTDWLNPSGDPMIDGGSGFAPGPMDAMRDYAAERQTGTPVPSYPIGGGLLCRPDPTLTQAEIDEGFAASRRLIAEVNAARSPEPDQPALIEETEDERAQRAEVEFEAAAERYSRDCVNHFAGRAGDWMSFARFRRRTLPDRETVTDHLSFDPQPRPEDLSVSLVRALFKGELTEAGALLAILHRRAGMRGVSATLAQMPADLIGQIIAEARAPVADEEEDDA